MVLSKLTNVNVWLGLSCMSNIFYISWCTLEKKKVYYEKTK